MFGANISEFGHFCCLKTPVLVRVFRVWAPGQFAAVFPLHFFEPCHDTLCATERWEGFCSHRIWQSLWRIDWGALIIKVFLILIFFATRRENSKHKFRGRGTLLVGVAFFVALLRLQSHQPSIAPNSGGTETLFIGDLLLLPGHHLEVFPNVFL